MTNGWFVLALIILVVVGIVIIPFFAAWMYGINAVTGEILNVTSGESSVNISDAAKQTLGYYNTGLDGLKTIAAIILLGYLLSSLVIAYFSREHPILFILYILITAMLIIFSVYIQNAFEDLQANEILGTKILEFGLAGYIATHLTAFIVVIALIGFVLMAIGGLRERL